MSSSAPSSQGPQGAGLSSLAGDSRAYVQRLGQPIVAIASGAGGSVGVIRLSGRDLSVFAEMFRGPLPGPGEFALRDVVGRDGSRIDRALVLYFQAPHSFSGENVIEIQGHGVESLLGALTARACELGARQALPGEFSFRAVWNEKMSLEQAERLNECYSIADLKAKSASALLGFSDRDSARAQEVMRGLLELVQKARGRVEAAIDFSEAEQEQSDDVRSALHTIDGVTQQVSRLMSSYENFNRAHVPTVVLVGAPNAGKSTLLNILAEGERALVSPVAGTTRDFIEARVRLPSGQWIRVIDTAGLREVPGSSSNPSGDSALPPSSRGGSDDHSRLELLGMQKTRELMQTSRVIVWVRSCEESDLPGVATGADWPIDTRERVGPGSWISQPRPQPRAEPKPEIEVWSHRDLATSDETHRDRAAFDFVKESAACRDYILRCIASALAGEFATKDSARGLEQESVPEITRRQFQLLKIANDELCLARACLEGARPIELCADHLRQTELELNRALGRGLGDEYIGQIFSQFCLGK